MPDAEKKDVLLAFLADLYEIEASIKEPSPELLHKIRVMERRLSVLGVTDYSDLKP